MCVCGYGNTQSHYWLDSGTWSFSVLTSTELLIQQPLTINVYVYMCIHISVMYMHVYLCVCACVSHSLSCEYSCLSAAFFQQEEGRKQQIRGIQES